MEVEARVDHSVAALISLHVGPRIRDWDPRASAVEHSLVEGPRLVPGRAVYF